jgi:hypothetical protein
LIGDTDSSGDSTNYNLLVAVQHTLNGGGSPSSTVITAMNSVIANGPQGTTPAKAIAPGGEIMDYPGNCKLVLLKFQEALVLLGGAAGVKGIKQVTDSVGPDPNLTIINGLITTLS